MSNPGKIEPVQIARHGHIREHNSNIISGLKNSHSMISGRSLDHLKAVVLQGFHCHGSHSRFVLDDQDQRSIR
jgi:hypothetical protein